MESRLQGYDLIGDIHGCAHTLEKLLDKLGYSKANGVYAHPERKAIFLGDIVDRGPRIRESLHIVKPMVDGGHAEIVLGNHEYNALTYCTAARPHTGHLFLREHNARNHRLILETVQQFEDYPDEWQEFLAWFLEIPLFIEKDAFRVVHACWDEGYINKLKERLPGHHLDEDFLHESAEPRSFAHNAIDRLTRGTALELPDGETILSKDGLVRRMFRTKFWSSNPEVYQDVVFQPDPLPDHLQSRKLSAIERQKLLTYDDEQLPVFVGHYWMSGMPHPIAPNVACLDYSAVKYGKLVAYRMDNESILDPEKFVWVSVDRSDSN